jgi:predicted alpha/beta hydrolase
MAATEAMEAMEAQIDPTLRIPALDGFELAATLYEPPAGSGAGPGGTVVLINSATAVKRGYYDAYARHLAGAGFSVLTYDYRGIGGSRPRRLAGFEARMLDWGRSDLSGILEWIGLHLRPRKLLVVGHSVGGQIVGLTESNWRIGGLFAVASQSGWWGHWPVPARFRIAFQWYLVPVVTRLFGYLPGAFGTKEDLPAGVAREWARWGRRPGYLFAEGLEEGFARFQAPLCLYSFTDDPYAPRPAVESLLDAYTGADITHRHLTPAEVGVSEIGHFGFFRERFRDTLWQESVAWLRRQERAGDRPSRRQEAPERALTRMVSALMMP